MSRKSISRIFSTAILALLGVGLFSQQTHAQAPSWVKKTLVNEATPNVLKKIGGNGWYSGAVTANVLEVGADGKITYTNEQANKFKNLGLGPYPTFEDYSTPRYAAGWRILQDGRAWTVFLGNQDTQGLTNIQVNDVFEVERIGNTISWLHNGTAFRTETYTATEDWRGIVGIYTTSSAGTQMGGVQVNFNTLALAVDADIVPASADGSATGAITLNVSGGTAPYTYSWTAPSSNASTLSNLAVGSYEATITDATGRTLTETYHVGYAADWQNDVRVDELTVGTLTSTNGTGWNSGASSRNALPANKDGWFEFELRGGNFKSIGFSEHPELKTTHNEPQFSFYVNSWNQCFIQQNGSNKFTLALAEGDRIRVARDGDFAKFYVNGALAYSLAVDKTKRIVADLAFYINNSFVQELNFSFNEEIIDFAPTATSITDPFSDDASITPNTSGSTGAFTFNWSDDPAAGENRSDLPEGSYTLTANTSDQNEILPFITGYDALWIGGHNYFIDGLGAVTKTAGTSGWSTAYAAQQLDPSLPGTIQYIVTDDQLQKVFGFRLPSTNNFPAAQALAGFYMHKDGFLYTVYNGAYTAAGAYDINDVLQITRIGSTYKFLKNGDELASEAAINTQTLQLFVGLLSNNASFSQVLTTFNKGIDFGLDGTPYASLSRTLSASYYIAKENQLRFSYQEEYNPTTTSLKYRIFDEAKTLQLSDANHAIPVVHGANLITVDLSTSGHNFGDGYYILEVENGKQEKWHLRFRIGTP